MNEDRDRLSNYVVASNHLNVLRSGFKGYLLYSTRTGKVRTVGAATWEQLNRDRITELPPETRNELRRAGILVSTSEDELSVVLDENQRAIEEHDVLYQVVQPSAWCQLDCGYCGQVHQRASLSIELQTAFLERVRKRLASGRYKHLRIGWFGAEPLVGIGVIRTLTPALRKLAIMNNCDFGARIVTNGLALTPAMAIELTTKLSISEAEITLDGTAPYHDLLRPTKKGRDSFKRIFTNVVAVLQQTSLGLVIRCNVGQDNVNAVSPLLQALYDAGVAKKVRFYTSPVYSWGNDAHKTALTPERYAEAELEWLALQFRLGFEVGLLPQRRPIVCMAVQREAEVLDAHGNSFNCTEVPYVPTYGEPSIYAIRFIRSAAAVPGPAAFPSVPTAPGSVRTGRGDPAGRLASFNDQIRSGEQAPCRSCKMLPVCGGQCPKAWHERHEPCPSAKTNIVQRLDMLLAMNQLAHLLT